MHTAAVDTTFFDHEIETLPRDRLRALQEEKLAALLEQTYGSNLFVTEKLDTAGAAPGDVRTIEDLAGLPFTTKAELIAAQGAAVLSTNCTFPEAAYTRIHQTSGTTGEPLRVFDTVRSWQWWGRCWGFVLAAAGVTAGDRLFVPFSFGPFIGFWAALGGAERIGALMIPGGARTSAQRLQLMADLGVTAMCCTPTYALRLVEAAREGDFDLSAIPMRTTVHAGEPGSPGPTTWSSCGASTSIRLRSRTCCVSRGRSTSSASQSPGVGRWRRYTSRSSAATGSTAKKRRRRCAPRSSAPWGCGRWLRRCPGAPFLASS